MIDLVVNSRFKNRSLTGVERFASEICRQLKSNEAVNFSEVDPGKELPGLKGHAWEQMVLPRQVDKDSILFSPCNTGPVFTKNQAVIIHDAAVWDFPEGFSSAFGNFYRALLPKLAKRARWVGTVSEFSRERLAECLGIDKDSIFVLGNATSDQFVPPANNQSRVAKRLFCVGSIEPRKNFDKLLAAWSLLEHDKSLPEGAELRIAGGTNPRNFQNISAVEDSKSVKWLGRISDSELIVEYQSASGFVFPSLYEGFGLPPLEAFSCGCPVLMSDCASLPEVGGPRGEGAAIYFDPNSVESIASSIGDFLSLDQPELDNLSEKALQRSREFSWQKLADSLVDTLTN